MFIFEFYICRCVIFIFLLSIFEPEPKPLFHIPFYSSILLSRKIGFSQLTFVFESLQQSQNISMQLLIHLVESYFIKLQPRQSHHFTFYWRSYSFRQSAKSIFSVSFSSQSCFNINPNRLLDRMHRSRVDLTECIADTVNVWCDRNIMPTSFCDKRSWANKLWQKL